MYRRNNADYQLRMLISDKVKITNSNADTVNELVSEILNLFETN